MILEDLKGKAAVVTGAGGGMGRHIALELAKQGARLAICDINETNLEETAQRIKNIGAVVVSVKTDITNEEEVIEFYKKIAQEYNTLDILINCAAIWDEGNVTEIDSKRWERMIHINLSGTFYMCREAFPLMQLKGEGSMVNFASTAGEYGSMRPAAHYAASKGGIIALSKSLAREGAKDQIRVNVISPGPTDTPMLNVQNDDQRVQFGERTLLGRIGTPQDMANAAMFLASSASSWITGDVLRVNGGSLL
ncbi:MAG TPA: SDR family oxidoreductase [Bacilli bacterium]